jgi:hypothetical protein
MLGRKPTRAMAAGSKSSTRASRTTRMTDYQPRERASERYVDTLRSMGASERLIRAAKGEDDEDDTSSQ